MQKNERKTKICHTNTLFHSRSKVKLGKLIHITQRPSQGES